ncbi:toxin-activating lysine-acyltransferase [Pseudoponticoccus marisrubri]|uniref:RTX toxin-activating lysine-acyltransferase n=1 Tax=Pseudoponticoccus marisrubri TaxID=1685382 RepID=A0A0W7WN44_9RHOB|nr:toxin-activating lysine-acyltransferase [Pseudoponticoccus marisrubri]KUF11978.1 hypothetical protein AVJ23_05215 [Pseudoponticoccus marisrubri]
MNLTAETSDPRRDPDAYDRNLGRLALLGATTATFGRHRLDHAVSILHGALMTGQFRIYLDEAGRPAGALIWAMLSEEMAETYLETGRLPDVAAWTSGPDLWLLSIIAQGPVVKQVVQDAFGPLFRAHERAFVLRPSKRGDRRVVAFTRDGVKVVRRLPPVRE